MTTALVRPIAAMATAEATALALLARGLWPVGISPPGIVRGDRTTTGKEPLGARWGAERWTVDRIRETFRRHPEGGVGVCLGPGRAPGGAWLADIEGDGPEAEASRLALFGGETIESAGWDSTRGAHQLVVLDPARLLPILAKLRGCERRDQPGVYKLPDLPGLELRIGGEKADGAVKQLQSVVPPTPGTDGTPRAWNGIETIAEAPNALYERLAAIAEVPPSEPPSRANATDVGARAGAPAPDGRRPDPETRAVAYLAKCDPAISGQGGHNRAFAVACRVGPGFDLPPDVALRLLRDHWNPRCEPPWSIAELEHKIADAYRAEAGRGFLLNAGRPDSRANGNGKAHPLANRGVPPGEPERRHAEDIDAELAAFPRTDTGNAERLARRHGEALRYCHPWGKWLLYDGRRWGVDQTAAVRRLAKQTARRILSEAATVEDDDRRKALATWALATESKKLTDAMLAEASALEGIPILPGEMDRDPWAFNCTNGTIDLRTGEIRPHRREDHITKLCPVEYDPDAGCPEWLATLDLFFSGNRDLIGYWQRICGYAMAGVIRDHIMPICYGTGANGKSTILGTLLDTFGPDYAMKAPPNLLMARSHEPHPTERADLFGKRLVVAIETEAGGRLNETLLKELTGGDVIRARRMREDHWQFHPTHTLVLATNHKPTVRGTDKGIWRRLKLVPFRVCVEGDRADTAMPEKLARERPGILAWCVRGCLEWQANGLDAPANVVEATEGYRSEQDTLGGFLDEFTVRNPGMRVKASHLFAAYEQWTRAANEFTMSMKAFSLALQERGVEQKRSNGIWYCGIDLIREGGEL